MKKLLFFIPAILLGQFTPPSQPDCAIPISLNSTGVTVSFDNRFKGCIKWTMTYDSQGFSALSIVVQSAPDAGATPGTWVTFAGTILAGVNPNISTTQAATYFGTTAASDFQPWVRANLTATTGTGTVTGWLYGYRSGSGSGGGGGGGTIPLTQQCLSATTVSFDTSASGNTLLVAAAAGRVIRACKWALTPFTSGNSVTTSLQQGTGPTCGGSTATLDGPYENVLSITQDYPWGLATTASNALCLNLTSSTRVTGSVQIVQYTP